MDRQFEILAFIAGGALLYFAFVGRSQAAYFSAQDGPTTYAPIYDDTGMIVDFVPVTQSTIPPVTDWTPEQITATEPVATTQDNFITTDSGNVIPFPQSGDFNVSQRIDYVSGSPEANIKAFAEVVGQLESGGNYYALALSPGQQFTDISDHPAKIGPWRGARRPDGRLTTAAGKYQITLSTWTDPVFAAGKAALGITDFSPESQDKFAYLLIQKRGKGYAEKGNFDRAAMVLSSTWEALKRILEGSYGKVSMDVARQMFADAGGGPPLEGGTAV